MSFLFVLALAQAATAEGQRSDLPPLSRLVACRAIVDQSERLTCFDRASSQIVEAQTRRDLVVLNRAQVQSAKRSMFGFSLPSTRLFGEGETQPLDKIVGIVRTASSLPGGRQRLILDDASIWETTDQSIMPMRVDDEVTIKAGRLGSYSATATNRRSVKVWRVR